MTKKKVVVDNDPRKSSLNPSWEELQGRKATYICDYCQRERSTKKHPPRKPDPHGGIQICPECVAKGQQAS